MSSLVLLLNDFHKSRDVSVLHFGGGHVHKTKSVVSLEGVLVHQFKLHEDNVILDVN